MKAHKTVIEVTLYSDTQLDMSIGEVDLWDELRTWMGDAVDGDKIGDWKITENSIIEGDALRAELVAIGNDGSFFDDPFGVPICDICDEPEDQDPTNGRENNWNGETGCHLSCEEQG